MNEALGTKIEIIIISKVDLMQKIILNAQFSDDGLAKKDEMT